MTSSEDLGARGEAISLGDINKDLALLVESWLRKGGESHLWQYHTSVLSKLLGTVRLLILLSDVIALE